MECQPDHDMHIDEDHLRSRHSSEETAGKTTAPTTVHLPARKL
jgi:hypothetical protein